MDLNPRGRNSAVHCCVRSAARDVIKFAKQILQVPLRPPLDFRAPAMGLFLLHRHLHGLEPERAQQCSALLRKERCARRNKIWGYGSKSVLLTA